MSTKKIYKEFPTVSAEKYNGELEGCVYIADNVI